MKSIKLLRVIMNYVISEFQLYVCKHIAISCEFLTNRYVTGFEKSHLPCTQKQDTLFIIKR